MEANKPSRLRRLVRRTDIGALVGLRHFFEGAQCHEFMNADILDILFEGRNKEYGAYNLRKTYNGRLAKALIVTAAVILLLCGSYFLSNLQGAPKKQAMDVHDLQLIEVAKEKPVELPKPIELPKPQKIEMKQYTPPRIVKDDEVKKDEIPPENDKLDDVKIGTVNEDGAKDLGVVAPPISDNGKGVVEAPKKEESDEPFMKVEKEAEFPGGMAAWQRFLNKNFHYPDEAQNNEIQGTVVVQFIVDKEGNVSDVQVLSGPEQGGLREEAVRVIRKSGKWIPAIQNGNSVKAYRKQPIIFKISE